MCSDVAGSIYPLWLLQADPFKLKTGGGLVSLQDLAAARTDGQ